MQSRQTQDLDSFVDAFEAAHAGDAVVELGDYLPDPGDPLHRIVLRELVRVDLEYGWTRGRPHRVDHYRDRFPQLFVDLADVQAVTFEEFRLRQQAGEEPNPDEYRQKFGVDVRNWPVAKPSANHKAPNLLQAAQDRNSYSSSTCPSRFAASREPTARLAADMPAVGTEFLGFRLMAVLGRGAFATVYLAQQGELADRPVVLKIARDILGETRNLAQLQHTNIVPVYSVHHGASFQAICMPYFGPTTLAHVLRDLHRSSDLPVSGLAVVDTINGARGQTRRDYREGNSVPLPADGHLPAECDSGRNLRTLAGLSYIEAVLWIGARLAAGLAHAHDRGILHRDLKPANILLADDGQPMLLDFNLSEDLKLPTAASTSFVGGTLPYMAPEHLRAFRSGLAPDVGGIDKRCDIYSLGVILFEMLTGQQAFPSRHGSVDAIIDAMLADRCRRAPALRKKNRAVTWATEAIVMRCLEPDPKRRYETAAELQDDLERQLHDLPLRHTPEPSWRERAKKWAKRHPRLTSVSSIAFLAGLAILMLGSLIVVRGERLARFEAAESLNEFRKDVRVVQVGFLQAGAGSSAKLRQLTTQCEQALGRWHILDEANWQTSAPYRRLSTNNQQQVRADAGEMLFLLAGLVQTQADDSNQQEQVLRRALDCNVRAQTCFSPERVPLALRQQHASLRIALGESAESPAFDEKKEALSARDCSLSACSYTAQRRFRQALPLWQEATRLDPQNVWAWYGQAHCHESLGQFHQAAACFSACIALSPDFPDWFFRRGMANLQTKEYLPAKADFDQTLRMSPDHVEAHVNRALANMGCDRFAEAVHDFTDALRLAPNLARFYFMRAQAREKAGDAGGAREDRMLGQTKQPSDELAWIARGIARVSQDPHAALDDFARALELNPRSLPALENQAHLLAEKLGRVDDAIERLNRAVTYHPEYAPVLAARGVLHARLGRNELAERDAEAALGLDSSPACLYQVAGIYALTSRQKTSDRVRAMKLLTAALRQGFGRQLLSSDPDLESLRSTPEFGRLLQAIETLRDED